MSAASKLGATTPAKVSKSHVKIREMIVDDVPKVFHLGEKLYSARKLPFLYRTWDAYEVAYLFSSESELSLTAELNGEVVGFCLSTTVEKPKAPWRYGYLIWLGVSEEFQKTGVGRKLVRELISRMKARKVKFMLIDTEETNAGAIKFFRKMGFEVRHKQTWMWKNLGKSKVAPPENLTIDLIPFHSRKE